MLKQSFWEVQRTSGFGELHTQQQNKQEQMWGGHTQRCLRVGACDSVTWFISCSKESNVIPCQVWGTITWKKEK